MSVKSIYPRQNIDKKGNAVECHFYKNVYWRKW